MDFVALPGSRLDGRLHAVQREVGQQWRDKPALRCARGSRKQLFLFPVTGFQPRFEQLLIHWDVLQQPVVADFIETSLDISFQHPLRAGLLRQTSEALFQSIGTTAAFAKTIGVSVSQSLGYGCECQRVERLHGPVVHGGNAQGSEFAVGLGDVMPAQGPGFVSVTFEVEGSLEFLSVRSPSYIIYTGRFSAPVRRYPAHSQ